jgi:hypothetical protein
MQRVRSSVVCVFLVQVCVFTFPCTSQTPFVLKRDRCEYTLSVDSHLPKFIVTVVLDTVPDALENVPTARKILLSDSGSTHTRQALEVPLMMMAFHPYTFTSDDYNFDGYPDLNLMFSSASGGSESHVWLYMPKVRRFAYSKELSGLSSLTVDKSRGVLIATVQVGACCGTMWRYSFHRGRLTLLEEEQVEFDYDKGKKIITRRKYHEGKVMSTIIDTLRE